MSLELKSLLPIPRSRDNIRRQETRLLQIEVNGARHRDEDKTCKSSSEQKKRERNMQIKCQQTNSIFRGGVYHFHDLTFPCVSFFHILLRVNSTMSGGTNIPQCPTQVVSLTVSSICVPIVDLTRDDEDTNSHVRHPVAASRELRKLRATSCGMFQVSHPIPSQTGINPWQLQSPSAHPHGSPALLVQTTPHRTHTRSLCLSAHARSPDVITCFAQGLDDSFVPHKSFHLWSCLC